MFSDRFTLPFLAGILISAAERRRPGLGPWTQKAEDEIKSVFRSELAQAQQGFFEVFDDTAQWERTERTLMEVCLPRYCAAAKKQSELEQKDFGLWRGGDLIARGVYAAAGLIIGIVMVKVPFIPIPQTWDFFALLTMMGAPFIPDLQVWLHKRRYRRSLERIVDDMRDAEAQQKLYLPLDSALPAPNPGVTSESQPEEPMPVGQPKRVRNGG
jgi:hypothetical protein